MKNLKNKIFPLLIALSALSVSASAAFYSVSGLSKLFAGASLEVIIMASSLEVAKLVIASLLYQYWDSLNKGLRAYLTVATCVLILITSAGIYGFLSGAYQETANKEGIVTQQITALETKKALYEETRDNFLADRKSNNELRGTLSKGSTTQFTDKNGNLIIKNNNSVNIESTAIRKENEKLAAKLDVVNDSIFALETQILETKVNSEAASELGPLKYLSELTGVEMNRIINWLLLVIIFVFDPLAIALVIAANFAFNKLRTHDALNELTKIQEEEGLYDNEGSDIYTEKELEELKDWDVTLMDGLEEEQPKGIPVYFDPKTGRPYIIEADREEFEIENNLFNEDNEIPLKDNLIEPLKEETINLDLNNDGIISEDEFKTVFKNLDTNNDGILDLNDQMIFNLNKNQTDQLNIINNLMKNTEHYIDKNSQLRPLKQEEVKKELNDLKQSIIKSFLKKENDDDIKKYF